MEQQLDIVRPFGQTKAIGQVSRTREIRGLMQRFFEDHPETWDALLKYLVPQGSTGNTQGDHMVCAYRILEQLPVLREQYELRERECWYHFDAVLRMRGYKMSQGYIVGHLDDDKEEAVPEPGFI